jgi:type III secretion system FlhB-like substrate exporter
VREDADLAELLRACELGDEIPPELFDPVARVLARLYRWNAELASPGARTGS